MPSIPPTPFRLRPPAPIAVGARAPCSPTAPALPALVRPPLLRCPCRPPLLRCPCRPPPHPSPAGVRSAETRKSRDRALSAANLGACIADSVHRHLVPVGVYIDMLCVFPLNNDILSCPRDAPVWCEFGLDKREDRPKGCKEYGRPLCAH
ncbi:hypothetical protein B0H13DRAFT_632989 [Mycena leptocephala]|nr:hypothetical protein B0H13DRAFT_632989 [Mycena leptocephala]